MAGNLDPPSGPGDAASQMYTLEQIYDRLDTGAVSAKMTTFTEPVAGPGSTGHTLDEVMALAMKVGQADPPCFSNTERYVNCGNGTMHDLVTNLVWLKNANCFGALDYADANNAAAGLEDGECGLTDGSSPGDWRLPTLEEWETTVARAVALGCTGASAPALTSVSGTECFSAGRSTFEDVQLDYYWSSTAFDLQQDRARVMNLTSGSTSFTLRNGTRYAWPVRSGQ